MDLMNYDSYLVVAERRSEQLGCLAIFFVSCFMWATMLTSWYTAFCTAQVGGGGGGGGEGGGERERETETERERDRQNRGVREGGGGGGGL